MEAPESTRDDEHGLRRPVCLPSAVWMWAVFCCSPPNHAMPSQSHSVPAPAPASQANPRQRYLHLSLQYRMMTTTYRGFFVLCGYAPRASVENLSRHANDCTALPSRRRTVARNRFQQQARDHLSCACACTAHRRGLIACSSYPRLVCLQIIIFRAVFPFPYRLSRCLFRLRGILKDHLAFLIQTNAPPTNHASR